MKKLPDQYDDAIVGVVERCGQEPFVAYDENKLVELLMNVDGMTYSDAIDHYYANVKESWVGDDSPGFLSPIEEFMDPDGDDEEDEVDIEDRRQAGRIEAAKEHRRG